MQDHPPGRDETVSRTPAKGMVKIAQAGEPENLAGAPPPQPAPVSEQMERILREATRLFNRKGYAATTTRELAEALGMNRATLQYHIGSKETLLFLIHQQANRDIAERWRKVLADSTGDDFETTFRAMIREQCRMLVDRYDEIEVFGDDLKHLGPERRQQVVDSRVELVELIAAIMEQGVSQGYIDRADATALTSVVAITVASTHRWFSPHGRMSADELAVTIGDLFLGGILAAGAGEDDPS